MSKNERFSLGCYISPSILFIVFLVIKLTEKCTFWGDCFPRFLKSTETWWDGWFMVFLPLWIEVPICLIIVLIVMMIYCINE
jgi:hypothetical protein